MKITSKVKRNKKIQIPSLRARITASHLIVEKKKQIKNSKV